MLHDTLQEALSAAQGPLVMACLFFLWRFWNFTMTTWLQPSLPKKLPYSIPVFGHVREFFWNSVELMENAINYTGRSREPVAIQLPGKKMYLITQPQDVTQVFNNLHGLDNDSSLKEILKAFGCTSEAQRRAWHVPQPGDWCYIPNNPSNPKQMCFIKWVQDSYRKHLLTPDTLNSMSESFVGSLLQNIELDSISPFMKGSDDTFSLYDIVRNVMVEASAESMFGSHLQEIDPNAIQHMLDFNDNAWQVVMRYPDFFGRLDVSRPRKEMMAIMRKFVERPRNQNVQANTFVRDVLEGMETTQLDMHSRAAMMLMIFWASVSNEYNGTFWLLTHLLYDEPLLEQIKLETESAWEDGVLHTKRLVEQCPVLDAVFNEVLRHKNGAGAMRSVSERIVVGGKELQPGNLAYIPFHQLHTNENVWGANCLDFDHTRFLKRKALARNTSFRPFGGGATYCPGRTLAKIEIFGAVAIILHRFDIRLAVLGKEKQRFPILNIKTPSLGVNGPVRGMDVLVELTSKKATA